MQPTAMTSTNGDFSIVVPTDFPYSATTYVLVDDRRNDGKVQSGAVEFIVQ